MEWTPLLGAQHGENKGAPTLLQLQQNLSAPVRVGRRSEAEELFGPCCVLFTLVRLRLQQKEALMFGI